MSRRILVVFYSFLVCGANFVLSADETNKDSFPEVSFETLVTEEALEEFNHDPLPLADVLSGYEGDFSASRLHSDSFYHCVAFSDYGDVVQLHDYSKWEVSGSGQSTVVTWVVNDDIIILPCTSWFSFSQYVLYNITTNQCVEVNLISPPHPRAQETFHIVNIEPYQKLVLLSDNTVWRVAPGTNFNRWRIGQRLLVGVNKGWTSSSYPQILINVDLKGQPFSQSIFYGYPAE